MATGNSLVKKRIEKHGKVAMWSDIALIVGAYLLGSAPHLLGLSKLRGLSLTGDLHINLWRRGGSLVGLIGIFTEFVKGVIPVLVGRSLGFSLPTVVLAGLAVVVGQMWPVFSKFDGEKGNSIGVAMAGVLAPKPFFVAAVVFAIGAFTRVTPRLRDKRQTISERLRFGGAPSRSLPLGMITGFLLWPVASWWLGEPLVITLGLSALFILIVIRRLTAGLRADLEVSADIRSILINRLLYDRSFR